MHLPQRARGYWTVRFHATREGVENFLERERAQLPLWLVVGFGAGIASWFALDGPSEWLAAICVGAGLAVGAFSLEGGRLERAVGWFGLACALGCSLIWLRSDWVSAPRLHRPTITTFNGTVEQVEVMAVKGDLRLTVAPTDSALPPLVRVSIKADTTPVGISSGASLKIRARLASPPPPRWLKLDRKALEKTGGVSIRLRTEPRVDTVSERLGQHPWALTVRQKSAMPLSLEEGRR